MVNELKQMKNLGKKDYNEKLITLFKEKNVKKSIFSIIIIEVF